MEDSRLTIISTPLKRAKEWRVDAKCICGSIKEYRLRYLQTGHTKSCGCINKKHGFTKHPLFKVWQSMKERCYNFNHSHYHNYGGRGIVVCNEWLNSPADFCSWGLANGYKKGLQLDRTNNDGNYEPSNCRFVTPKVNLRNRRGLITLEYDGETKLLSEWAEQLGLPIHLLRSRLNLGWSVERAFTTPSLKPLYNPKPFMQVSEHGEVIRKWNSLHEYRKETGAATTHDVWMVLQGLKQTAHGFKWEYVNN